MLFALPRSHEGVHKGAVQNFLIGRLLRAVFVLWGVSTVVFLVLRLSGDPIALMVSRTHRGPTLELALLSILLTIAVAIPVGVLSALKRNSVYDAIAMAAALLGQSMPTF